jgi:hypothetical protein
MKNNNNSTTGISKKTVILIGAALVLILISYGVLIYLINDKSENIKIKQKEIVLKDSLINDYKLKAQQEHILSETVKAYLSIRLAHNYEGMNEYYADTLDNYYKYLENCSKSKVMEAEKKYWTSFKTDSFIVKAEPEIIIDSTQIQATVKGLQCIKPDDCIEEIMVFKFNRSFKITSVKAYFLK